MSRRCEAHLVATRVLLQCVARDTGRHPRPVLAKPRKQSDAGSATARLQDVTPIEQVPPKHAGKTGQKHHGPELPDQDHQARVLSMK